MSEGQGRREGREGKGKGREGKGERGGEGRRREGQKNKNKMRSVREVGRHTIKGTSTSMHKNGQLE